MFESEVLNRNLQKTTALYSRDACNLVNLTVTWRLTKGRKFRAVNRSIQLKDSDTGIIRCKKNSQNDFSRKIIVMTDLFF